MADVYDRIDARQFFDFTASDDEEATNVFFDVEESPKEGSNLVKYSRMSMSTGDVSHLQNALQMGIISNNQQESSNKTGYMSSQSGVRETIEESNIRSSSQDNINRLAKPKKYTTSADNVSRTQYVPMAEAVRKFHTSTPDRFHLKFHPDSQQPCVKKNLTKPKTPNLLTKGRTRSVTEAIAYEEKEWLEFQQQQKFKIKANPLNKKVLMGPLKPVVPVEKKPPTVPEPFKLTSMPHKVVTSTNKISTEFKAQPVPKSILEPPQCKFPLLRTQKAKTVKSEPEKPEPKPQVPAASTRRRTVPLPFSFEVRNKLMKEKKEKLIRQFLEDEKKAREFYANPIPKAILEPTKVEVLRTKSQKSLDNNASTHEETTHFKARPATVLQKKPFVPIKPQRRPLDVVDIKLKSDLRAEQREAFDRRLKEREAALAMEKQLEEMRLRKKEEEEVKIIRKMTEYKAQPVKKYKEVIIQPSGKVTDPVSPNFHYTRRERQHKENKENIK